MANEDIGGVESGFFVRKPSWGRGGTLLEDAPTSAEALQLAGLDWTVDKQPIWRMVETNGNGVQPRQIKGKYAIVRSSDDSELGVVGEDYKTFQNAEALEFLDGLVQDGEIKYETAGALFGGKRVWIMCKTPDTLEIAGGDKLQPYMFVSTSHDGSAAITAAATAVRIECANTLTMAVSGAQQKWSIRHTKSTEGKLQEAREALGLQIKWDVALKAEMDALVTTQVTDDEFTKIMAANFKAINVERPKDVEAMVKNRKLSETIQDEYRPTAWGALNAASEYVEHLRTYRTDEARTKAVLLGWGHTFVNGINRDLVALSK